MHTDIPVNRYVTCLHTLDETDTMSFVWDVPKASIKSPKIRAMKGCDKPFPTAPIVPTAIRILSIESADANRLILNSDSLPLILVVSPMLICYPNQHTNHHYNLEYTSQCISSYQIMPHTAKRFNHYHTIQHYSNLAGQNKSSNLEAERDETKYECNKNP